MCIRDRHNDMADRLAAFAKRHARLPTLGFTHFQAAQPVSYTHLDVYKRQVFTAIRRII